MYFYVMYVIVQTFPVKVTLPADISAGLVSMTGLTGAECQHCHGPVCTQRRDTHTHWVTHTHTFKLEHKHTNTQTPSIDALY